MPGRWRQLERISEKITEENVDEMWRLFFTTYLEDLGYNKQAIDSLFEWGKEGHNWRKLWNTENEVLPFQDLQYEMQYIYDRMSLDRLFRCHWIYNQYKLEKEKQP